MKNRPLTEAESQRLIALTPWIAIVLALLLAFLATSCATPETLLKPNTNDRLIVGVTNNGKAYKVVNCYGNRDINVKADTIDYSLIGSYLICEFRY